MEEKDGPFILNINLQLQELWLIKCHCLPIICINFVGETTADLPGN